MPTVRLLIKSPAGSSPFELEVSPEATLAEVQGLLAEGYDGKPAPEQQTLIFAGKVLKDPSISVRQLIEQSKSEPFEGPHSFHLVVRKGSAQQQQDSAASSSMDAAAATASAPPARMLGASGPAPSAATAAPSAAAATPSTAPAQAAAASAADSTAAAQPGGSQGDDTPSTSGTQPTADRQASQHLSLQPYMYVNPVYAAAYQAAYAAAMAAVVQQQAGASQLSLASQPAVPMSFYTSQMYQQRFMPASASSQGQQQQQQHPGQLQMQMGYAQGLQQPMVAHIIQGGPHGPEIRIEGLPQEALGPVAMALANLRQRRAGRGAGQGGVQGMAAGAAGGHQRMEWVPQGHGHGHGHGRMRRFRGGIALRISVRTMLQILVFAMVLYQHFMWHRFIALIIGGLVLYLTSTWGPLRRVLANLQQPPPARPAAPAVPGVAAGEAPAEGAAQGPGVEAGNAGAAAAAAPAVGDPAQLPRPRGVLQELLVLVLGFITSLLPTWNYNPEDAAAFAVAQDIAAREDRERALRQQQQALAGVPGDGQGEGNDGGGGGGGADAVNAGGAGVAAEPGLGPGPAAGALVGAGRQGEADVVAAA